MLGELIEMEEASRLVLAATAPLPPEAVRLDHALGRILAEDVRSAEDLPPFDSSAMDGYAVVAGKEAELTVVGESRAGSPAGRSLTGGEAIRISTGAVIPDGADAVVPIERVEESGERVRVPATRAGANVRRTGEDVRAGEVVLAAGAELGPAEVAALASLGLADVRCGTRPRVAVVSTGDELVEPGQPLSPGAIRDSNGPGLAAMARRAGAEVVLRTHAADDPGATLEALGAALAAADVLCVAGGVSVGGHDHVKEALSALGVEQRFWGVRLKPGKPTWFGTAPGKLVFGLPGNPVSAMVTFHLFARPAIRALAGAPAPGPRPTGRLAVAVRRSPARDEALRCRIETREDGWHLRPTKAQGSHVLTSMIGADALAIVPAGEGELPVGERVEIDIL